jgi:dTMP kinase
MFDLHLQPATANAPLSGKFIVCEGVEGAGKTTQIELLQEWLIPKWDVLVTREPGGTELGRELRQLLLIQDVEITDRAELLLYAADRAHHIEAKIKPHLAKGGMVLCDRFTDSTIAYQCYGRGLDRDLVDRVNFLATGGLQPDLTFWFDLDVALGLERAANRGQQDKFERLGLDFHRRVSQGYRELADGSPRVRIDASLTIEQIQNQIRAYF